jgi:hypothetical protein
MRGPRQAYELNPTAFPARAAAIGLPVGSRYEELSPRPMLRSRPCRSILAPSPLVETCRRPLWVALDSVDRPAVSTESLPNLDRPWVCALPESVPAPYCRRVL